MHKQGFATSFVIFAMCLATTGCADSGSAADGAKPRRDGAADAVGDAAADAAREAATPIKATIGAAGGLLESSDKRLLVEIPAGALDKDTEITVEPGPSAPPGAVGPTYRLGPDGLTFNKPLLLTFKYRDADLGGVPVGGLRVGTIVDGAWVREGVPAVDTDDKALSIVTDHFSAWGVFATPCKIGDGPPTCAKPPCQYRGESCVQAPGRPAVFGIACSDNADCPHPTWCLDGMCTLRGCTQKGDGACNARADYTCSWFFSFKQALHEFKRRICLPSCTTGATISGCPGQLRCLGTVCGKIRNCGSDSGCAPKGLLCYRGGLMTPAGFNGMGVCLPCRVGCDCADPSCHCDGQYDLCTQIGSGTYCEKDGDCPTSYVCSGGNCTAEHQCQFSPTGDTCPLSLSDLRRRSLPSRLPGRRPLRALAAMRWHPALAARVRHAMSVG